MYPFFINSISIFTIKPIETENWKINIINNNNVYTKCFIKKTFTINQIFLT